MGVSKNNGTPKSSILVGFSIIFTIHFGGKIPLFLVQHPYGLLWNQKSFGIFCFSSQTRINGSTKRQWRSEKFMADTQLLPGNYLEPSIRLRLKPKKNNNEKVTWQYKVLLIYADRYKCKWIDMGVL